HPPGVSVAVDHGHSGHDIGGRLHKVVRRGPLYSARSCVSRSSLSVMRCMLRPY
ncbi:hypothetical protein HAX54_029894, partial [Datura stramonium]|nr:hypothetical protein [Datura stramonium]